VPHGDRLISADGPFPHGLETFLAPTGVGADSKRKIMWTIVYGCMDSQKRFFLPIRRVDMPFHPAFQPIVALIAGILILIMPRLLNYVVAIYLIIIGVLGLLHRTL
jgi:hypothetical protein